MAINSKILCCVSNDIFHGYPVKPIVDKIAGKPLFAFLLLATVGLVLMLPGTATLPLMDRDEPKFAQATWEMMETEQYTIPFFNKSYRFDKPPLTYWWMRLHYHIFGKTEIGARLHSVFASILTAYVIFLFGRFLYSNVAGLLSGLAWLTCLQVLIHSRLCVADMPMLLGVTLTMYAVARLLFCETEPRRFGGGFWLLVAGLSIGFLAKGPVAWIVPILSLLLWRWPIGKHPFAWKRLQPVSVLLISTAIVAVWGIKALVLTKGGYWDVGVGEHVVKRGVSAFNGRANIPVVYYLVTGILSLLPWSAFIPSTIFVGRKAILEDQKRSFLTAWFVTPFLVFAFYATQLPHYILPGFPGFILLLFSRQSKLELNSKLRRRWFYGVVGAMGFVSLLILVAGLIRVFPDPMDAVNGLIVMAGLVFLLVGVLLPLSIKWAKNDVKGIAAIIALVICAAPLTHLFTKSLREIHPIIQLTKTGALESLPDETKLIGQGFSEPSWVFYHWKGEKWLLTGNLEHSLKVMDEGNAAGIFLLEEWRVGELAIFAKFKKEPIPHLRDQRETVMEKFGDESRYETIEVSGLNIARTSWVKYWFVRPKDL